MIKYTKKEKKAILKWLKNQIDITENHLTKVEEHEENKGIDFWEDELPLGTEIYGFLSSQDFYRTHKYLEGLKRLDEYLTSCIEKKIPEFHTEII